MLLENELGRVLSSVQEGEKRFESQNSHCLQLLRVKSFSTQKGSLMDETEAADGEDAPKPAGGFCDSFSDLIWGQKLLGLRWTGYYKSRQHRLYTKGLHVHSICWNWISSLSSPVPYSIVKVHFLSLQSLKELHPERDLGYWVLG